jgi:predicted phage terminase large subunit-like protein
MGRPRLSAEQVSAFTEAFLLPRFDESMPIAPHHLQMWDLVCRPEPRVAFAVPRKHAKTTCLPKARGLAAALYKQHPFQLKVGSTHDLALEIVAWCKEEMLSNEAIRNLWGPRIIQDQVDDLVVELADGYRFRWVATGIHQAKRGFVWGTMRPTLIDIDDVDEDEDVLNVETRDKVKKKIRRVILPMGGDETEYRMYGTIMHQDSSLSSILSNPSWVSIRLEACDEEVNEASILWPEKFPKAKILDAKQEAINGGDLGAFNMEWRNIAIDTETGFFRPEDFRPMTEEDHARPKTYYVGGDLAFSKKEKRDYTVFTVGGVDEHGILHIVDERRGRWDGNEVIDEMYRIEEAWEPKEWFVESGAIKDTLGAALEIRMGEEGYLNLCPGLIPSKDKATRATPLQARMRAKGIRFDTESSWFSSYQQEMLEFAQEGTRGAHDDRVDATAWLAQGLKQMAIPLTEEENDKVILLEARRQARAQQAEDGDCTGYSYWRAQSWGS